MCNGGGGGGAAAPDVQGGAMSGAPGEAMTQQQIQ